MCSPARPRRDAHIHKVHKKLSRSFLKTATLDEDEYDFVDLCAPLHPLRAPSSPAPAPDAYGICTYKPPRSTP